MPAATRITNNIEFTLLPVFTQSKAMAVNNAPKALNTSKECLFPII